MPAPEPLKSEHPVKHKQPQPLLLIAEDDQDLRETLCLEFQERGYQVLTAQNQQEVLEQLQAGLPLRFAIVDLRLQADSGLEILRLILAQQPECRVVMLTGYGSIATAVEAVKRGAVNYLTKPARIEQLEKALWMELNEQESETEDFKPQSLDAHEQEYLEYVLLQCQGNISEAARWLGIHRQSLQRKLKRTGLR